MNFDGIGYDDLCKVVRKIGAVYSRGFSPWALFVKTDMVRLIESARLDGFGCPTPTAKDISTYQDCVAVKIVESDGKIMIELSEYPGALLDGRINGPVQRRYLFEVLQLHRCLVEAVAREFRFYVEGVVDAEEHARKIRLRERAEKKILKDIGIC